MKRLARFRYLPAEKRHLLLRAAFLMPAFRLGLWILPFRRLMNLATDGDVSRHGRGTSDPAGIAWAVQATSRYVPHATCLVQALTAKVLLESAGLPACLHIGVSKPDGTRFEAHAWVESLGKVISGGTAVEQYSPLLRWEA